MGYKLKKIYVGSNYVRPIIPVTGISLDKSSIIFDTAGQTYQLTATVTPSDATNKNVTWSSTNGYATVSDTGLVTCVTPGECIIRATTQDGGYTASCSVELPDYLCFTANVANSTIKLHKSGSPESVTIEYSMNRTSWSTYTFGTQLSLSRVGAKVYFRNASTTTTGLNTSSAYYHFIMTGSISASGDVNYLINKNSTSSLTGEFCYRLLFYNCTALTTAPRLPALNLTLRCYLNMFNGCTNLTTLPSLPATNLTEACYQQMFYGCSKIKLSTTQTGEYQTAYRIPNVGTGILGTNSLNSMFYQTGGTFTGTPSINTTYYTSNTVV